MLIGRIEGANVGLGKPADWDNAKGVHCQTLPVLKRVTDDDDVVMSSAWFPTLDELALLNKGRPIYLHIFGPSHPPVSLTVELGT